MERDRLEEGKMRNEVFCFGFFKFPLGKLSVTGVIHQKCVIPGVGIDLARKSLDV